MILLDTNVVSEPMRHAPDRQVIQWIDAQPIETLFLSAITIAELRAGVALMSAGKRSNLLHQSLENQVFPLFAGRMLSFDEPCTRVYGNLLGQAKKKGFVIATADAMIAAIASTHGYVVATRDVEPFKAVGVRVINPWNVDR